MTIRNGYLKVYVNQTEPFDDYFLSEKNLSEMETNRKPMIHKANNMDTVSTNVTFENDKILQHNSIIYQGHADEKEIIADKDRGFQVDMFKVKPLEQCQYNIQEPKTDQLNHLENVKVTHPHTFGFKEIKNEQVCPYIADLIKAEQAEILDAKWLQEKIDLIHAYQDSQKSKMASSDSSKGYNLLILKILKKSISDVNTVLELQKDFVLNTDVCLTQQSPKATLEMQSYIYELWFNIHIFIFGFVIGMMLFHLLFA